MQRNEGYKNVQDEWDVRVERTEAGTQPAGC